MKKSGETQQKGARPSGGGEQRLSAQQQQPGQVERATTPPRPSVDERNTTYQVRLAPATSPLDASTVSSLLPPYQQGTLPSVISDEVYLPGADEEVAGIPPTPDLTNVVGTDQDISALAPTEDSDTQDEVFSAYLVLSPEERRRRLLEQAVSATNVHVIEPRTRHKKWSKHTKAALTLCVVVAAIVAISLCVTLGGRKDPTRFDQVVSLVESISNTTSLLDPLSPQHQAAQWMAKEDALFGDLSNVDPYRFRQRYVMALFYFATGGPTSWTNTSFFLQPGVHECEWWYVAPAKVYTWSGFIGAYNCSMEQWVRSIEINENNLTGTLPLELGSLSMLSDLALAYNSIGGTLPRGLFDLSVLSFLDLPGNNLTGTIPTDLGSATSLAVLGLHENSLTGTIPPEIGNLSDLEMLSFVINYLTGTIPMTLLQLSNLWWLDFGMNSLTGTLPPLFPSHWPNLDRFSVYDNHFTGTIPDSLDSLSELRVLNIGFKSNHLTGTLPSDWSNLSQSLDRLITGGNPLSGTLPESLGGLSALTRLRLYANGFNGSLPASLGNLTNLQALWLQINEFTGTVPQTFLKLTSLRQLSVHSNKITGDLSFLCNDTEILFSYLFQFYADCLGEVVCPCCNSCCGSYDNPGGCTDMVTGDPWYR